MKTYVKSGLLPNDPYGFDIAFVVFQTLPSKGLTGVWFYNQTFYLFRLIVFGIHIGNDKTLQNNAVLRFDTDFFSVILHESHFVTS